MLFKTKKMIRIYTRWSGLLLFLGMPLILSIALFDDGFCRPGGVIPYLAMEIFLCLPSVGLLHFAFWEKFFAYLQITDEGIVWKCPFRKTRFLEKGKCNYIGIDAEQPGDYIDAFPILYFSTKPYPEKYRGKIAKMKCSDDFIKFWYLDELAEYLLETFPREKTYLVAAYKRKQKIPHK